jgi:polysaccharide export outer membrane protein
MLQGTWLRVGGGIVLALVLAGGGARGASAGDGVSIADAPGGGRAAGWTTPPPTVRRVRGPAVPWADSQAPEMPTAIPSIPAPRAEEVPALAPEGAQPNAPAARPGGRLRAGAREALARREQPTVTFRFAVGDVMRISIWDDESQTGTIDLDQRILRDGTVTPIWLEPVHVAGLTIQEVRGLLVDRYLEYYEPPIRLTIAVVSVHAERAFILGEVAAPTAIELSGPTTVLQALAQAGSAIPGVGDLEKVKLIRNCGGCGVPPRVYTVNLARTMIGRGGTVLLQPGDVLFVPTRGVVDWTRDLSAVLAPLGTLLGGVGSAAATWLAIDQNNNNRGDTIVVGGAGP